MSMPITILPHQMFHQVGSAHPSRVGAAHGHLGEALLALPMTLIFSIDEELGDQQAHHLFGPGGMREEG